MIIVEELEYLLEKRGWYLHKIEFLPNTLWGKHMENYGSLCRCLIRFPCRRPVYVAIPNDIGTAKDIIKKVKRYVHV